LAGFQRLLGLPLVEQVAVARQRPWADRHQRRLTALQQRRAALLERGEAALVPICPGPLAGDGYLLDEWQSKQALKPFG
ncbi:hypothetical protein, partial [Pseudomonas aeruginosa]|uniref:hypothetical protein n=1 Tax=Pseudomonas aeruginosa TaxID=287 RepID=UPI000A92978B